MDAEAQILFLDRIQRILDEGLFTSTYKFALLLAIADICVEQGECTPDSPLVVSTEDIAGKFIFYYWRQAAPYPHISGQGQTRILLQNSGVQAGILKRLVVERQQKGDSLLTVLGNPKARTSITRAVASIVSEMPLSKLQNLAGGKHIFLYDDADISQQIVLLPGICYCFRKHHALISNLVRGAWVQRVRRFNRSTLGQGNDLQEFLFGAERTVLTELYEPLRDLQENKCFYCGEGLTRKKVEVDHFVPWSRYPMDLGHNFVLADSACNRSKSDLLAAPSHLERWVHLVRNFPAALEQQYADLKIPLRLETSARIVEWAYSRDCERQAATWVLGSTTELLTQEWNGILMPLMEVGNDSCDGKPPP